MMAEWIRACLVDELPPGSMLAVGEGDERILVANVEGSFYAISAICTHAEAELDDGYIEGEAVVCPLHYYCFSLKTGEVLEGPADEPVTSYPVEVRGGVVYVQREKK